MLKVNNKKNRTMSLIFRWIPVIFLKVMNEDVFFHCLGPKFNEKLPYLCLTKKQIYNCYETWTRNSKGPRKYDIVNKKSWQWKHDCFLWRHCTKFSIKNFFSKYDQIRNFPRTWSHLHQKSLIENFIFLSWVSNFIFQFLLNLKHSEMRQDGMKFTVLCVQ